MRVGDLVKYTPTHTIAHLYETYGDHVVGLISAGDGTGHLVKLRTPCGKDYWAVTKDCEVISESR